jgi:hypothetical protein
MTTPLRLPLFAMVICLPVQAISQCAPSLGGTGGEKGAAIITNGVLGHLIRGLIIDNHEKKIVSDFGVVGRVEIHADMLVSRAKAPVKSFSCGTMRLSLQVPW